MHRITVCFVNNAPYYNRLLFKILIEDWIRILVKESTVLQENKNFSDEKNTEARCHSSVCTE